MRQARGDAVISANSDPDQESRISVRDPQYLTAMAHFYRGELGRMLVWRQRLDASTTWAVTSTMTIIGVAFSWQEVLHVVFFFNWILVVILLWVEARRYRFYDASRARVRVLEKHYLVPVVTLTPLDGDGHWREWLRMDLLAPAFKISWWESVARRLRRTYGAIFVLVWVAWTAKILMHSKHPVASLTGFVHALDIPGFPDGVMHWLYGLTTASLIPLLALSVFAVSRDHDEFNGLIELHR
jgi:uncharacterized membrane protein